ncbi:HORMA domain-containing protein 1 [Hordeum vulgare]|nr:HORMA domain-containing protein 1 [Hordeum vulgare]
MGAGWIRSIHLGFQRMSLRRCTGVHFLPVFSPIRIALCTFFTALVISKGLSGIYWKKGCESSITEEQTMTKGLIGPSLGPLKDIQNESSSKISDSFAETDIPSFHNTASCVVMPLQSPTNGAYYPTSTACYGSSNSGSVAYSAPFGTSGLPVKPWVTTHEHQGMPSTNMFHSADAQMKVSSSDSRSGSDVYDVDYDEELALRIAVEQSKVDNGGSSRSGASSQLMRQRSVVVLILGGELYVDVLVRSGFAAPFLHLVAEDEGRSDILLVEHGVDLLLPSTALLVLFHLPRTSRRQHGKRLSASTEERKSFGRTTPPAGRCGTASAYGSIFTGGSSSRSLFTGGRE